MMSTEGFNLSKTQATYNCIDCDKSVTVTVYEQYPDMHPTRCEHCALKKTADDQREELKRLKRDMVDSSGIVAKFQTWDEAIATETGSQVLLPWIKKRAGQSIWLGGTNGIGKSHAAHYVAYLRILEQGDSVMACRCSGLLNDIVGLRSGNTDEKRAARAMLKRAQSVNLLLLDDLCKEKLSLAKSEILWDITDVREREGLRIWITTNRSGQDLLLRLGDDYGPAILKRLRRAIPEENILK
jgi:DNA replication protein DnaC